MTITEVSLQQLDGQLLRPGDQGYDDARRVWNGAVDRRPAFVLRCASTNDVAAGIRLAAAHGLPLAVRGGGHSIPGHSTCEGGLQLDLSLMRDIRVDPARRTATVGPGATWRELDAAAWEHGLATTGGEISDTGVAGLTLGGGIGWLSRLHGHACDSLLAAELVTASGEVLQVDDTSDPELLWGLRGGGGNLGVVTAFTMRLHPTPAPYVVSALHPATEALDVLRRWRDLTLAAPRQLASNVALVTAPPVPDLPPWLRGQPVVGVTGAWFGDPAEGEQVLQPLRVTSPHAVERVGVTPYPVLQQLFDAGVPWGVCAYARSDFVGEMDDDALAAVVAAAAARTSPMSQLVFRQLGGACSDVPPAATAFAHRDARYLSLFAAMWADAAEPGERHRDWCRRTWSSLRPWSSGTYVNHLDGDEGADRVAEAFPGDTRRRLAALKARVDPDNLFRLNVNVPPARS